MRFRQLFIGLMTAAVLLLPSGSAWATFSEDIERPQPKFTQDGGDWVAELIPRGKSSNIQIRFHVEGGTLAEPALKIFTDADMPKVDLKNYRSGFFTLEMTPSAPGGEVSVSISSTYFNSATDIWGVTERSTRSWGSAGVVNVPGEANTLTFAVKDGSLLDEDGATNGRIQVIIGPRDHFWGYAIGTLVIRFFGVFLVLGLLMIGMMISGKVFQSIDKRGALEKPAPPIDEAPEIALEVEPDGDSPQIEITGAMAAAVAVALHLHAGAGNTLYPADSAAQATSSWSLTGRTQLMADRMSAFDRVQRN